MKQVEDVLISIRPNFAEAIFSGQKTVELRRRLPAIKKGARLWIYVTKPVGAVMGFAELNDIRVGDPAHIWAAEGASTGLTREQFDDYFEGSPTASALLLKSVKKSQPIPMALLREMRTNFHPPQVLTRLTEGEAAFLRRHISNP